jgi:hypothetical protein
MQSPAWIEPGTLSICLYCSVLLLRGRPGTRLLTRQLRKEIDTVKSVALDEFSDFLCDHPNTLLTVLLVTDSLFRVVGPNGAPRCRLVTRAPTLLRSPKTLTRSTRTLVRSASKVLASKFTDISNSGSRGVSDAGLGRPRDPDARLANVLRSDSDDSNPTRDSYAGNSSITGANDPRIYGTSPPFSEISTSKHRNKLLHFLWRPDSTHPTRVSRLQQEKAQPEKPRVIRLYPLPAYPVWLSVLLRRKGRGKGPALHILCQLAAKSVNRREKESSAN